MPPVSGRPRRSTALQEARLDIHQLETVSHDRPIANRNARGKIKDVAHAVIQDHLRYRRIPGPRQPPCIVLA